MTISSTPPNRDTLQDQRFAFNCGQFARGITAGRPLSHRWVTAKECLCTDDTPEICDPTRLYNLNFYELSDEAMAQRQRDLSEKYPDIPPDQIGVFDDGSTSIFVPPHFMDVVWNAALAADGVLRKAWEGPSALVGRQIAPPAQAGKAREAVTSEELFQ
jgi:hypothetical protein